MNITLNWTHTETRSGVTGEVVPADSGEEHWPLEHYKCGTWLLDGVDQGSLEVPVVDGEPLYSDEHTINTFEGALIS
jgi:hypothetical protein